MISSGQLVGFTLASFVLIVVPGPGVLFVVGRALSHGRERIRGGSAQTVVTSTAILSVKIVSSLTDVKLPGAPFKCQQPD